MSVELSIIVPAYNAENYLEPCIDSIMASTWQDFEVLLVDDGSTDGTGALCDRLAEKYPKIRVFHVKNAGVAMARNLGIDHAAGKYIGFVDSDDLIVPQMFETMVSKMDDEIQMVCCRYHWCKRNEIVPLEPSDWSCVRSGEEIADQITFHYFGAYVWNKIFRRDVIASNHIRFKPGLLMEDQYFMVDYLRVCQKAVFLDAKLYYYIDTAGGIMDVLRSSPTLSEKYMGFPRGHRYFAETLPLYKKSSRRNRMMAAIAYMRVLRKLEPENAAFAKEAAAYVRKNLHLLAADRHNLRFFASGLLLSISYPAWKRLVR